MRKKCPPQAFVGIPAGKFFCRGDGFRELKPDGEFPVAIPIPSLVFQKRNRANRSVDRTGRSARMIDAIMRQACNQQSGRRRRARSVLRGGPPSTTSPRPERAWSCLRLVVRWSLSLTELGTGGRETDKAS
jgi:hypothetical protein